LTSQPFFPKLRLIIYVSAFTNRSPFYALLLAVIFLGAQFHFCSDLSPTPSASHVCPVCSATVSVVAAPALSIAIVPIINRVEVVQLIVSGSSAVPRATSPRAPPAI
jgi:hypothetical protein